MLATTGCGPALYHSFQQTQTSESERRVSVIVRSDPAGATIMTPGGMVLGQAPLIVEEKVLVRRSRRAHRIWLTALGFVIDAGVAAAVADAARASGLDWAWAVMGIGVFCEGIEISFRSRVIHEDEQVIPRTIEFTARWDGLGGARAKLVLPATRAATLRLPRTYTFDEALALWARESTPPLAGESLRQIGDYYRNQALRGVHGASERAIEHFTLYLRHHAGAEHAESVRHAIEELRRLTERAR